MNADTAAAVVVSQWVEIKTEMSLKAITKIMMRMMIMNTRETETWAPVVTAVTGMKMIQITTAEAEAWGLAEASRTKMIMKIMMTQVTGKDREETKAGVMVMKMRMIMILSVIQEVSQEEALAA
jgi:tRNA pseudouridine-54 N-methylase